MKENAICFLMPGPEDGPIGGYKVVYEYANRFEAIGWKVDVIYPLYLEGRPEDKLLNRIVRHPRSTLLCIWANYLKSIRMKKTRYQWFALDSRVTRRVVLTLNDHALAMYRREKTCFIATMAWTALRLANLKVKRKYHLIQDHELWGGTTEKEVNAIYRLPLKKIAISKWLCEKVKEAGVNAEYIPKGEGGSGDSICCWRCYWRYAGECSHNR